MSEGLKARLRECLAKSGWDFDPPGEDESLRDLGLDSLALALWVVEIERELGVKLPPARINFEELATFAKVEALVRTALGAAGKG
jgi:acyl carrier protein